MSDVKLQFDCPTSDDPSECDFLIADGDLAAGDDLSTAIMISLCTDARASATDELPDADDPDRRGWWADAVDGDEIGSKLWLLAASNRTPATLRRMRVYIEQALAWLKTDKIASKIDVLVENDPRDCNAARFSVKITKPTGAAVKFSYRYVWSDLNFKICPLVEDV